MTPRRSDVCVMGAAVALRCLAIDPKPTQKAVDDPILPCLTFGEIAETYGAATRRIGGLLRRLLAS